jgi:hypothetical protein
MSTANGPARTAWTANPTAAVASKPASAWRTPTRCASSGLSIGPTIAAPAAGIDSTGSQLTPSWTDCLRP